MGYNYGKPKRITDKGYFILFNSGCYGTTWYVVIPTHISQLRDRLKQTILDLIIKISKVITKKVITIFKIETKMSRVAYMNLMLNKLL